jgi:hypothetical protein
VKTYKILSVSAALAVIFFSNCATIVGGSKYYAHVEVRDNTKAKIFYQNREVGEGYATIKVNRNDINKFKFTVKQDGCNPQEYRYVSRTFRGWAFAGTIIGWTGTLNGVPLPWGLVIDLATGALWKPNVGETGVSKHDYKNFNYSVKYDGCKDNITTTPVQLQDVVYLKNGSIIRGVIIEQVPAVSIKIKTKDENIFVFKVEEIEKIVKE